MNRLGLLVMVLAVGCAKKDDGSFSNAQARDAGNSLAAGIEDSAKGYGKVSDGTTADSMCVTLSGDTADPDMDSIPNNAKLTYNCTGNLLGLTTMLTGTMGVVDNTPAAVAWSFTGMADLRGSIANATGKSSIVRDWDGMIVATQATAIGPYRLQRTLDINTVFTGERLEGGGGSNTVTVTEDIDWAVVFTPMATWTPGGVIVTGSLGVTGTWNVMVEQKMALATLGTPTPLTIDPACASLVTAGVVSATYVDDNENDHAITVTWTGCGMKTVTSR